jgi:hypothetical protein
VDEKRGNYLNETMAYGFWFAIKLSKGFHGLEMRLQNLSQH